MVHFIPLILMLETMMVLMPNSNGTATVLKFGDLVELRTFLCSLANELKC